MKQTSSIVFGASFKFLYLNMLFNEHPWKLFWGILLIELVVQLAMKWSNKNGL